MGTAGWICLWGTRASPRDLHPSQLFHNNHDGTFTEMGAASGLADLGFVKGVAWGDYNNDGRPDLYVSVMGGKNHLFRNDGPRDAQDIQARVAASRMLLQRRESTSSATALLPGFSTTTMMDGRTYLWRDIHYSLRKRLVLSRWGGWYRRNSRGCIATCTTERSRM